MSISKKVLNGNDDVCRRSYLILRPKSKSDPDPDLATVLLFIWPWMFLITLADLVLLAFIAGLTRARVSSSSQYFSFALASTMSSSKSSAERSGETVT